MTTVSATLNYNIAVATAVTGTDDDRITDDTVGQSMTSSAYFLHNLLLIVSSFKLITALASSISISGKRDAQVVTLTDSQGNNFIHNFSLPPNPLDLLDISSGCVPVSVDADARQIRWPNWAILLPEIPKNIHFTTQGAII